MSQHIANITVHAMLLADHIYRDESSGKYVIAGVFHQYNALNFPTNFDRNIGIFISLSAFVPKIEARIEFVDVANETVLLRTPVLEILLAESALPVEFALEMPPVPLPHAGFYLYRLVVDDHILSEAALSVEALSEDK